MRTEWLKIINNKKNSTYPEWKKTPVVLYEDTSKSIFDIVDTRDEDNPIFCDVNTGTATYYNGNDTHHYELRFIKIEKYFNQFRSLSRSGKIMDWAKGMSRPDYIAYDISDEKVYFIIHELSDGSIQNKKPKAMKQLLNMVKMLHDNPKNKIYCQLFKNRLCYVSAKGCVTATPFDMAIGFMEAYKNLPDPIPLNNKSIENRKFKAYQSNVVRL